jgi:RNA recognition motif-containing protein
LSPKRRYLSNQKRLLGDIVVHDHRTTSTDDLKSNDPALLACRVFIGNLPTDQMVKSDLEDWFKKYGKVIGSDLVKMFFMKTHLPRKCVALLARLYGLP